MFSKRNVPSTEQCVFEDNVSSTEQCVFEDKCSKRWAMCFRRAKFINIFINCKGAFVEKRYLKSVNQDVGRLRQGILLFLGGVYSTKKQNLLEES